MQHLTSERIAALADSPATLAERAHLNECVPCVAELAAAQRLMQMALTDIPAIERPLSSWERLSPALKSDGLITTPIEHGQSDVIPLRRVRAPQYRWAMQAAAGVFIAVGGAVVGRASAAPASPKDEVASSASTTTDTNFKSAGEAMTVLQRASTSYQHALAYLAANDSNVTMRGRDAADLYQTRLSVLDQAVAATQAALYRAPQDPVLKNYYAQSVGARDLTLRQLGRVTPVSLTGRTKF